MYLCTVLLLLLYARVSKRRVNAKEEELAFLILTQYLIERMRTSDFDFVFMSNLASILSHFQ